PAPLCVGFGWAAEIAEKEMADEALRLTALRDRFLARLRARVPDMVLNGDRERRIPGNLSLGFPGVNGDRLIAGLKGISVSSGSACSSASIEPSYVLAALGVPADLAQSALRIGLGRFTTAEEVDRAADEIAAVVEELRADATPEAPAETGA
ncbi:MAG: aminotransferase class V-fold PLP-dependent enzyme, partial [Alphaproteobacteria bacterium]